jgi:hypothetical protein
MKRVKSRLHSTPSRPFLSIGGKKGKKEKEESRKEHDQTDLESKPSHTRIQMFQPFVYAYNYELEVRLAI